MDTVQLRGSRAGPIESAIKHQTVQFVMCHVGSDDTCEEFSITHGRVSSTDSRSSLAGTDTQCWNVSILVAHFRYSLQFCLLFVWYLLKSSGYRLLYYNHIIHFCWLKLKLYIITAWQIWTACLKYIKNYSHMSCSDQLIRDFTTMTFLMKLAICEKYQLM